MIQSDDWTTPNLVKYLVKIQNILSATEMKQLRATCAFMQQASLSSARLRFRAGDLYEPNNTFRQLGLPVIDWGITQWRRHSKEGQSLR